MKLDSLWPDMKAFDMDISDNVSAQNIEQVSPTNNEAIRKMRLKITQGHHGKPLLTTREAQSHLKKQNKLREVLETERESNLAALQLHDETHPRPVFVHPEDVAGGGVFVLYKNESYKVHTGSRGGKYILVGKDKTKVYVDK
jgi:hypothetical protein